MDGQPLSQRKQHARMNSEEIRARIAQLEAEAEQRSQSEGTRRSRPSASPADGSNADGDPWDFLFDAALRGSENLGPDGFSLNSWLADGLYGLRGVLRGLGVNDEFRGHLHAAERELLLACRVLIDTRLERLDPETDGAESPSRLQNIDIDFDA